MPEPQLEAHPDRIEQPFFFVRSAEGGIPPTQSESVRRSWVTSLPQKENGVILVNFGILKCALVFLVPFGIKTP